jgi:hypothetical protein
LLEKEKKKQTTTGNNLTTTRLHVSRYVEEKTIAHPMRQQIARFGHRMASHAPPKWCENTKTSP